MTSLRVLTGEVEDRLKTLVSPANRRRLVTARLLSRAATAKWRVLPDVLIIGAQRAGTSSLYKYLGRHPDVAPSLRKETEYFSRSYSNGESWYRSHFALGLRSRSHRLMGRPLLTFEATPDYLFDPRSPQRAFGLLAHAKLVVLLRNPADRAFSHYQHMRRLGFETLEFEDALAAEPDRTAAIYRRLLANEDPPDRAVYRFSYLRRGRYVEQLERWMRLYDASQLLVIKSEDLYREPESVFADILSFLRLRPWQPPEFKNYSYVGRAVGRTSQMMESETRSMLKQLFDPLNRELYALLGRDLRWDRPEISDESI